MNKAALAGFGSEMQREKAKDIATHLAVGAAGAAAGTMAALLVARRQIGKDIAALDKKYSKLVSGEIEKFRGLPVKEKVKFFMGEKQTQDLEKKLQQVEALPNQLKSFRKRPLWQKVRWLLSKKVKF